MPRRIALGLCWSVALLVAADCRADLIKLRSGQTLKGDVLKELPETIYLDVGVDVIRVPVDQIESREEQDKSAAEPEQVRAQELYSTAKLPERTVKDLTLEYGEGVVLVETPSGLGSGFIINERGFCVTNYHVVERETRIAVTVFHRTSSGDFERRRIADVEIAALNPFLDLALLRIPEQTQLKFKPVYLAAGDNLKEGDEVFAIGNPLGLERSVSQGIVSTRNRNFEGLVFIQTTTEINPGNSGGPLFNTRGEVVGVTNMKLAFGEGLGFAIPVSYLRHFLDNRDAFAFDKQNPNSGYRYLEPPRRRDLSDPPRTAEK